MNTPLDEDVFIRLAIHRSGLGAEQADQALHLYRPLRDTPPVDPADFLSVLWNTDHSAGQSVSEAILLADQLSRVNAESSKTDVASVVAGAVRTHESATPRIALILLHAVVPRTDRDIMERDLEEQLEDELRDPLIGLPCARLLYSKRVADNILEYTWNRLPKRARNIILCAIIAGILKSLGLLPSLAALNRLGLLPWK